MDRVAALPEKLALVMRALSFSRVALAQHLAVDKSLVGRWLSGGVHPTEHNLARLTALIAAQQPDFRLVHWFADMGDFAALFGLSAPTDAPVAGDSEVAFLGPFLARTREETRRRGSSYEGFWRTTRPSLLMSDRLFHDYGMIRQAANGLLEVRMRGAGLQFAGWMLPGEGNLFVFLQDPVGMTPMSLVFQGVSLPRAMVLDGILLLAALDATRTPGALPILLERIGDLSGDARADDARCDALAGQEPEPLEPLDPRVVQARIFRTVESGFLSVGAQDSLSRGTTGCGLTG